MNPEHLPIRVRLEWPAGVIQTGKAKKPNVQEFERDGKQYVAVTAELDPPFDHLAHAQAAIDRLDTQETTMSTEYSADDFKNARFATHGDGATARRARHGHWDAGPSGRTRTDEEMARGGWRPVMESRVTERTLEVAQSNAERKRQRLLDHIVSLEAVIRRRNEQIDRQTERQHKLEDQIQGRRAEHSPLSLDHLEHAWDNAESADSFAPGDVVIEKISESAYAVMDVPACGFTGRAFRILSRAPQREPHDDLTEVIREVWPTPEDHIDIGSLAYHLHERGVRVTGGDES